MISILQRKHQTILLQNDKLVIVQGRRVSGGLFALPGILQEMVICKNHAVSIYEKGKRIQIWENVQNLPLYVTLKKMTVI